MNDQQVNPQPAEKKPPMKARTRKRRMARDLMPGARREMISQFECRGVDSDADIAEAFETQRPSVLSTLVDELYRRVRRIERKSVSSERVVSIDARRGAAA